jgi:hypothetical protein
MNIALQTKTKTKNALAPGKNKEFYQKFLRVAPHDVRSTTQHAKRHNIFHTLTQTGKTTGPENFILTFSCKIWCIKKSGFNWVML